MGIYVPCTKCSTHVRGQEQASRLTFETQVHLDQPLANVLLKKSVTPGNELIPCSLFFDHSSLPSTIPVPDKVVEFPKPKKNPRVSEWKVHKNCRDRQEHGNGMGPAYQKGLPWPWGSWRKPWQRNGQTNLWSFTPRCALNRQSLLSSLPRTS